MTASPHRRLGRPPANYSARSQILKGALEAFATYGVEAARVEDILAAAQVSRRTFYRVYRNKEQLFAEIFERSVHMILATVESAVAAAPDTPLARLEAGIRAFLTANAAHGRIARVLLTEPFRPGSPFAAVRARAVDAFMRFTLDQYAQLKRKSVDPLLLRGVFAALERITVELASTSETIDVERGTQVMLRIAVASLAEPGEPLPPLPLDPNAGHSSESPKCMQR